MCVVVTFDPCVGGVCVVVTFDPCVGGAHSDA